jgi:hypothetical protein
VARRRAESRSARARRRGDRRSGGSRDRAPDGSRGRLVHRGRREAGARGARQRRRSREQRRRHRRQPDSPHEPGVVGPRPRDEPDGGLSPDTDAPARDGQEALWTDRQRHVGRRPHGQPRAGQLRRVQSGADRPHEDDRAGARFAQHYVQCRRARFHRDRDDAEDDSGGARGALGTDPGGPSRRRGRCRRKPWPSSRRSRLPTSRDTS